jgi:hypothetical protein
MQPQQPPVNPRIAEQGMLPVVMGAPAAMPPPPGAATDAVGHNFMAGDYVKLAGLAMNPEYENKVFLVETPNVGDGRVMVKFQHGAVLKKMYFDPSALEKCEPLPHEVPTFQAPPAARMAMPGQGQAIAPRVTGRVRIVGLTARPEHDGKFGWVVPPGIPDPMGHVKVQLDGGAGGATVLDLPPSYLEQCQDPAAMPPAAFGEDPYRQVQMVNETGLNQGDRVLVKGLAARPQYNGKTAVVESTGGAEVLVRFEDPSLMGIQLHLKPSYLDRL